MSSTADMIRKAYCIKPHAKHMLLPRAKPKPRSDHRSIEPMPHPAYSHLKRFHSIAPPQPSRPRCAIKDPLMPTYEDGLDRLEELLTRSHQARTSRLQVQMEMLNLGVKEMVSGGRVPSLSELEDLHVEEPRGDNPADALILKYENQLEMRVRRLKAAE